MPRGFTEGRSSISRVRMGRLLYPNTGHWRPQCRSDCANVPRPCPYVGCRYNLYLDVHKTGKIKYNLGRIEPWDVPPGQSCALDLAELGAMTLEDTGTVMGLTRERVRQLQDVMLEHAREESYGLEHLLEPETFERAWCSQWNSSKLARLGPSPD